MFRKTTLFTLLIALVVIILSSYARSTGVGLGCPDWPVCFGEVVVSSDADFIAQAQKNFPFSRLDIGKASKEMSYRYLTAFLAVMSVMLMLFAWTQKHCRLAAVTTSTLIVALCALLITFSMWLVKFKGMPVIITGQVLLGFIVFWASYWLYLRTNKAIVNIGHVGNNAPRLFTIFSSFILLVQIVLGIWVSTNGAALSCPDFPQCNGSWLPAVNYLQAIDLFAGLESGYKGVLAFDSQVAIHWLHRIGAVISFIVLTLLMMSATSDNNVKEVKKSGLWLSILLLVQVLFGIFSVKFQLPLVIEVAHSIFGAILMLPLINILFYSRYGVELESKEEVTVVPAETTVATTAEVETQEVYVEPSAESLYLRLSSQLKKTRTGLSGVISALPLGQKEINEDLLEQIEASLIMADIGIEATTEIIAKLTESLERHQLNDGEALQSALKAILLEMLQPSCHPLIIPQQEGPFVILVVGINGVGKTTTIGKLAKRLQVQGHTVMLAAGDTFRAAAVEQLETWGERNNIQVVAQHTGADSASVIYDGVQSAKAKGVDVLIADTAGRLHTKANLMEELSKIKRIMAKVDDTAPHEVLLVLDAGTGQNALSQTKIFNESVELTGLALTKLDGTAKGGVIFALARQFGLPIRFIGVGEGIDDLQDFDAQAFVDALFVKD